MSVLRVKELTNIDTEQQSSLPPTKMMPRENARAGEALVPLLHASSPLNASLAPLDSRALVHSGWPWQGNIQFSNVSMRYSPTAPLVLDGVTLAVPAGTTLGVVGRTGSGKSSLLLTLFRLVEIESGGSIEIDGVDIRSVALDELRQSLAIIPQDPVLFAGTVAYNLDATGRSSLADMWTALEAASPKLADQFRRAEGLDSEVSEGGRNLSLGQRQLICLGRALLRKSRILVLDEATSSVDPQTDQEVQDTIRREFVNKGVTLITVAHRLDTVLGYDKIAVLGNGGVLEFGSPPELLRNPSGELRRLVDADLSNKQKGARKVKESAFASS
jgi:ABC-type multidrug transport system fused ATPase/permease subunit